MISFGFYNSVNHDRKYNAIQFGSMFDGIIRNGIFMSIGDCFQVTSDEEMTVLVGTGRAWFDHTWTLNDAPLPIHIPQSEVVLDRIDAIVLDINGNREIRKNDVMLVKGTPSKTAQRPTLIKNATRHQYPLAYISVKAGATSIRQADITSMIGTSDTPYVTGILETVNIDALVAQWKDQWNKFFEDLNVDTKEMEDSWKEEMDLWAAAYKAELDETAAEWNAWFASAQDILAKTENGELLEEVMQIYGDVYTDEIKPLQDLMGNTNISSIADGTVTGAVDNLKSTKVEKTGDTMTGSLRLNGSSSSIRFTSFSTGSNARGLFFYEGTDLSVLAASVRAIASGGTIQSLMLQVGDGDERNVSLVITKESCKWNKKDLLTEDSDIIKQITTGAASTLIGVNLTTGRALVSGSTGKVTVSATTSTELSYLSGATSNIQTQLNTLEVNVSKKQDAATAITTSNIGQQSVYYANAAGTAQWATDNTKMPLAGGNFTGVIGLANNKMNRCGDDCYFGDFNIGGCMAFKSMNASNLTGIALEGAQSNNYGRLLIANNGGDMYLTTNGKFFISNGNNSARAEIVASLFTQSSSRRSKTNIKDMTEEEAKKILMLSPVSFDYINDDMPNGCYGLIAEDTKPIIPSCVSGDVECSDDDQEAINGIGIDYSKLVPHLIKMIQLQEKRIANLEKRIVDLEQRK